MRLVLLSMIALAGASGAEMSVCGTEELLPIGFTPGELLRRDEIGTYFAATPPPPSGTRNPGEFEPMTGVFIRWPLGVPYSLIVDFSNNTEVWVICQSSEQGSVVSAFTAQGVNMANVSFVFASTNSIWVRDYGPWFLTLPDGSAGIFDFDYNRPRPLDDAFPITLGTAWSMPVYTSDIIHTGGNYMSSGLGTSQSTDLVVVENGGNEDWVDSQMSLYCGVSNYMTLPDPQSSYIDHIDCWGKLLSPDRVLILQVPPSHGDYAALEAMADLFEATVGPYGTPYQVFRVYSSGTEGYTNSLILNNRVYVPTWNTSNDAPAIASYQAAMPGYTIVGNYYSGWINTDALHCRTMGVTDPEMLWVNHDPVAPTQPASTPVVVTALVRCHPSHTISYVRLYYRFGTGGTFTQLTMTPTGGNNYQASIPGASPGTTVQYYVSAADNSGRTEAHPRYAPATWFNQYVTTGTGFEEEAETVPGVLSAGPWPNPSRGSVSLALSAAAGTEAVVDAWDLQGRRLAGLWEGPLGDAPVTVVWDPGDEVPGGVYLIRISTPSGESFSRVALLR